MIFATLEEIKALNEPAITNEDYDELINVYMEAIGATFSNHCNRQFQLNTYIEYHEGTGEYIFLQELPVRQINNIWMDANSEWDENSLLDPEDYVLLPDGRIWSLCFNWRLQNYKVEAIKVEYEGGFDTIDGESQDFPVPADLKLAFIRQIQYDVKRRKDAGISTVTFKDGSIYKQPLVELLPQVAATLDYYRMINI